jgi:hypothetical protein
MKLRVVILILGACLAGYGFFGFSRRDQTHTTPDSVSVACEEYERLFRDVSGKIASRLERGDLATDRESRDLRSEALKAAQKQAFMPLAEEEARRLDPWTPEKEAALLREYERAERK